MLGFIPGFAYIGGLDARLEIDRLPQPRQFVPAGSVGIAGGRTGLYALPGPGGWPLIGRTSCTLFDAQSDQPFVLDAGMRVLFTAVDTL
jgi:KipI family sensor histidine kinase inhibitor